MLCPLCGTPVGERVTLCEPCRAKQLVGEAEQRFHRGRSENEEEQSRVEDLGVEESLEEEKEDSQPVEIESAEGQEEVGEEEELSFAGFWLRFVAFLVDWCVVFGVALVLSVVGSNILTKYRLQLVHNLLAESGGNAEIETILTLQATSLLLLGISFFVALLYHTFMEASSLEGTLGKLTLNLHVVNAEGSSISFPQALIRNFSKLFSLLFFFFGFLIAAFTSQKQALHDILSRTFVIRRTTPSTVQVITVAVFSFLLSASLTFMGSRFLLQYSTSSSSGGESTVGKPRKLVTSYNVLGEARFGRGESLKFTSSLALWDKGKETIQIAFFPFEISSQEATAMHQANAFILGEAKQGRPYVLWSFSLRRNQCEVYAIERSTMTFYNISGASEPLVLNQQSRDPAIKHFDCTRDSLPGEIKLTSEEHGGIVFNVNFDATLAEVPLVRE